jgi:hypothetical protein
MPKTIYTERDIDELARRGVKEIAVTDQVYLTDVARERAEKLGITLSNAAVPSSPAPGSPQATRVSRPDAEDVIGKVKADVIAKLGPAVDPVLIDRIVRRVVSQLQ